MKLWGARLVEALKSLRRVSVDFGFWTTVANKDYVLFVTLQACILYT